MTKWLVTKRRRGVYTLITDTLVRNTYKETLLHAREAVARRGDAVTAARISDLIERHTEGKGQAFIAFCGLFSAGKSSLLNALCGTSDLATGAVPTTAEVHEVVLPDTDGLVILLDTPGVDSTDNAHQDATMAAMHRADAVVLVMDYQHVEAEDNIEFARSFSEQGKRLALVVNQIDKHFEFELPFESFVMRVKQFFLDWDIAYDALFFTTSGTSVHNQMTALSAWLRAFRQSAKEIEASSLRDRLHELVKAHVTQSLSREWLTVRERIKGEIGYYLDGESEILERLDEQKTYGHQLMCLLEEKRNMLLAEQQSLREALVRLVELAQISPYDTTELGRTFAESMRPDFKVGWLNAKQKTAEVRDQRLQVFVADLALRSEKYLLWPLQSALRSDLQARNINDSHLFAEIDRIHIRIDEKSVAQIVKPGALVSEQYPYQYVKDVVTFVKRYVLQQLSVFCEMWFAFESEQLAQTLEDTEQRVEKLNREISALSEWMRLQDEERSLIQQICGNEGEE